MTKNINGAGQTSDTGITPASIKSDEITDGLTASVRASPKTTEADDDFLKAATTGAGLIPLTPELLKELGEAAMKTKDSFDEIAKRLISSVDEANRVKHWRCFDGGGGGTWRYVAACAHAHYYTKEYDFTDWYPASNQLMGMALCETAASVLGEDASESPWN